MEESNNNWFKNLKSSTRYSVYKLYKQFRYNENNLNVMSSGISRRVASRFRIDVSHMMTHKLRFVQDSVTVCPMCMAEEEDEIPFILHCPVYHDSRSKYLAPFDSLPNMNTVYLLLRSVNGSLIKSLYKYLNQAFKRREQYCDVWWLSLLTLYYWMNCILFSFVWAEGLSMFFVFVLVFVLPVVK